MNLSAPAAFRINISGGSEGQVMAPISPWLAIVKAIITDCLRVRAHICMVAIVELIYYSYSIVSKPERNQVTGRDKSVVPLLYKPASSTLRSIKYYISGKCEVYAIQMQTFLLDSRCLLGEKPRT